MISLIEALNYRCLRYVRQPLKPFHVLVGPNASGKSTFLDVIGFLHDLVTDGLDVAIENRSANFYDLLWRHEQNGFELAVEAAIPSPQLRLHQSSGYDTVRYEIAILLDPATNELGIRAERGMLRNADSQAAAETRQPPMSRGISDATLREQNRQDIRLVFEAPLTPADFRAKFGFDLGSRDEIAVWAMEGEGRTKADVFYSSFNIKKSLLATTPPDEFVFPVSTWLRRLFAEGVRRIALDPDQLRRPSPPGKTSGFKPDGSNIPWVVAHLERRSPERHKEWIQHLQTALPDLVNVTTIDRPEDRHRYLSLEYRDGLKVPSWIASDGTLRLLALTLPAYMERFDGIYLVEEPENGIHPLAIETMYQSLSSVYDAQVLMATHSPIILGITKLEGVLCFRKDEAGATAVVAGTEHPELRDWHGEVNLGTLFASGVLG